MRKFLAMMMLVAPILVGCSGSRAVDADQIIGPGSHGIQSVMGSDIMIRGGSSLKVDYSSGNRFFVESGGSLTGFPRGVRRTRIYAEKGAIVPNIGNRAQCSVIWVTSVKSAYRDRFKPLPPLPESQGGGEGEVSSYYDDEECDDDFDHHHGSRRSAVSVSPESYRRKND